MAAWQQLVATRLLGCLLDRAEATCTARQMRNGLLLCNFVAWILILVAATLLT
jgi:hypothetical protein